MGLWDGDGVAGDAQSCVSSWHRDTDPPSQGEFWVLLDTWQGKRAPVAFRWNVSPWETLCNSPRTGNEIKSINTWGLSEPQGGGLKAVEPLQTFHCTHHCLSWALLGARDLLLPSLAAVIDFFIYFRDVCVWQGGCLGFSHFLSDRFGARTGGPSGANS